MKVDYKYSIEGGDFSRAGHASSEVKKRLKQMNVNTRLIRRIVIALYEAEVNIVAHAQRGTIEVSYTPEKVYIKLTDEGPGITDIDLAMQEGYSTASQKVREMGFGAGMGLSNMKKNADELIVNSIPGNGTTVELITYLT